MAKKVLTPLTELARQAGSAQQIGADTSSGSPQYSFNQSQLTSLQAMSQSPDQQGLAQAVREAGKSYITIPSSGRRILVVFQYFSAGEVAKLRPSPYNVRDCNTLNRDTVLDIYDSIQADGVVHPPYVLASADNFDVVDGWRRTYCLIDQKKGGMFGILQPDGELTPAEIRSISMVSNMRVGNSVWEIGRFITDVQQESSIHLSDRELTIRCGQHLSIVNLAKRAYAIPLTIYQLFEGQTRIGRPAIAKILRIWEPLDPVQQKMVIERLQDAPQEMKTAKALTFFSSIINEVTGSSGETKRGETIGAYFVRRVAKKAIQIEFKTDEEMQQVIEFLKKTSRH